MKVIDYPNKPPVSEFRDVRGQCVNRTLAYATSRFRDGLSADDVIHAVGDTKHWIDSWVQHLNDVGTLGDELDGDVEQKLYSFIDDLNADSFLARLNFLTEPVGVTWRRTDIPRKARDAVVKMFANLPLICLSLECPELQETLKTDSVPIHYCCAEHGTVRDWTGAVFATAPSVVKTVFTPNR